MAEPSPRHVVSIVISDIALRHEGLRPVESGSTRETTPPPTELNRYKKNQVNSIEEGRHWLTPYEVYSQH